MIKTRKMKVKSTEIEEITMAITVIKIITTTVIMTIIIILMMIMKINQSYKNITTSKQNKKCSSKSNSSLFNREKRSESHVLWEHKNHVM